MNYLVAFWFSVAVVGSVTIYSLTDYAKAEDRVNLEKAKIAIEKGLEECPKHRNSTKTVWVKDCSAYTIMITKARD